MLFVAWDRRQLDWWKETLAPLQTPRGLQLEQDEERAIGQKQISQALPKAITAYKTHALYAIERFLSQSEAVRPGGAQRSQFIELFCDKHVVAHQP